MKARILPKSRVSKELMDIAAAEGLKRAHEIIQRESGAALRRSSACRPGQSWAVARALPGERSGPGPGRQRSSPAAPGYRPGSSWAADRPCRVVDQAPALGGSAALRRSSACRPGQSWAAARALPSERLGPGPGRGAALRQPEPTRVDFALKNR